MINNKFIKVRLFKVSEVNEGYVFAGKIKFKDLYKICKFTLRGDPDLVEDVSKDQEVAVEKEFFQRQRDDKRIVKIQEFLKDSLNSNKSVTNIFPSSVILYNPLSMNNNKSNPENFEIAEDSTECFFQDTGSDDVSTLYIPNNQKITLIVDGQHRIYATKLLYESYRADLISNDLMIEKIENLEFIVTYLLGYDISWPAKIFVDVNFKQKPVNRSLYYDIFGSLPPNNEDNKDDNVLKLSHDLCVYLNKDKDSPIKGMIKMLGVGDGLFSQGFMVDAFRKIFSSKSGVWMEYAVDYKNGGQDYLILSKFMNAYLSAIRECYDSSWPDRDKPPYTSEEYDYSILCKTTGMGAFLRLIIDIFPKVYNKPDMKEEILKILKRISEAQAKELFKAKEADGSAARFAGAGAAGLQNALYKELVKRYGLNKEENDQPALFEKNS